MKKFLCLLVSLTLLAGAFTACAKKAEEPAATPAVETATENTTRIFTDDAGREVELPAEITSIAITGPLAQIVVFAVAPDKLIGIANEWDPSAAKYFDEKYYNLPLLGQLYGGKGELNLEELLKANPQVVIDVGEAKETIIEDMDNLTEQTGIPFVHIDAFLPTLDVTYTRLGELLGMEEEAKALADYCTKVYTETTKAADSSKKANILYITGEEGHNVIAQGSYHAEVIDLLTNNLAVVDEPSSKGTGNEVDMEQILSWNPEKIVFSPDSAYANVGSDPVWQQLDAIKNGNYYETPGEPYNWMGFPPSVQRLLGMLWMADTLYPDATEYDLYTEVAEYFKLFYHCELTQEQFYALVVKGE